MKKLLALALVPVLTGCLSTTAPSVSKWIIGYDGANLTATTPKYGVVRLLSVAVRAPYNDASMAVLRANGSMAFDPYNEYASTPAQLLKGVVIDGLLDSGLFKSVIGASSSVNEQCSVEAVVTRLALDCRTKGERRAVASVCLILVRDREIVAMVKGDGACDAANGNYGDAFSKAVSAAIVTTVRQL